MTSRPTPSTSLSRPSRGHATGPTLLTEVTTTSSTSPLKGLKQMHEYLRSNTAEPVPSRTCGSRAMGSQPWGMAGRMRWIQSLGNAGADLTK